MKVTKNQTSNCKLAKQNPKMWTTVMPKGKAKIVDPSEPANLPH